jgi:hypothetical protein
MVALTDAINQMPFVPGRIGQLGLFREQGVSTTSVMIEEREGNLTLVETTSRGAPAVQHVANKRKARSLSVPHIALEDTILADEVQNVRAFGSDNMLEGVQNVVNSRHRCRWTCARGSCGRSRVAVRSAKPRDGLPSARRRRSS